MFITTSGKGQTALMLIIIGFLSTHGAFACMKSESYYKAHILLINSVGAIVAGLVGFAYAYYLHKYPPVDDSVKLRDPKTGEFRSITPVEHEISGIPIELVGPLLIILGAGLCAWAYFRST